MSVNGKVHVVTWHDYDEVVAHVVGCYSSLERAMALALVKYEDLISEQVSDMPWTKDNSAGYDKPVWYYLDQENGLSMTIALVDMDVS